MGNLLDRADVPALEEAVAGDPHPLVRGHAAWPSAASVRRERSLRSGYGRNRRPTNWFSMRFGPHCYPILRELR